MITNAGIASPPLSRREDFLTMAFGPDNRFQTGASAWTQPLGRSAAVDAVQLDAGLRAYMLRVYNWMASGLLLTGIVAYLIANTGAADLFYRTVPLMRLEFQEGIGMAVRKEVLKRRGLITDASTRAPGATIDPGTKAALDRLITWTAAQEGLAWISA